MADSSLDDFFAKKDKSKKKGKSKLTPTDILAKQGEESSKKEKKSKKEKQQTTQSSQTSTENTGIIKDDEEWNEFEEETEKDYSGLRIQNLQISSKEETAEEEAAEEAQEEDENGEVKEKKDTGQQGPWKGQGTAVPQAAPVQQEEPPKPQEEEKPKTTGKYVPPGARHAAANPTPTGPTPLRKKKAAPNIQSEEDFPTLGGGPGGGGSNIGGGSWVTDSDSRSFERVQGGGKQTDDPSQRGLQLSLGNKYAALQN